MAKVQTWPELSFSRQRTHPSRLPPMNPLSSAPQSKLHLLFLPTASVRTLSTTSPHPHIPKPRAAMGPTTARATVSELKENWLDSLSCPFRDPGRRETALEIEGGSGVGWVVGIDPDASGAIALIKGDSDGGTSAQVFDTPHLQVLVGKRVRKRLDARSIVQLLHSFGAPLGTTAYIEQSNPFPKDGKQGWWSGGFAYGLWLGVLVSSGFSVVPISSQLWKDHFDLYRKSSTKLYYRQPNKAKEDDSRKAASDLFPSLTSSLKRKKDHGRAEALLIAAYGKGLRIHLGTSLVSSDALTPELGQAKS